MLRSLALLALFVGPVHADEVKVAYQAKTELDFQELEIAGELVQPEGKMVVVRKRASFHPMITLKLDFSPEMDRSVDLIK